MSRERTTRWLAWALVAFVLLGEVLFGAHGLRLGVDERAPLLAIRLCFFGGVLLMAGAGLVALPADRRPSARWLIACAAFPAWLAFQLVPLPASLLGALTPARLRLARESWPGPMIGCGGEELIPADLPAFLRISVDPAETWWFLAHVGAALAAFLFARAAFPPGSRDRRLLLLVIASFAALEAAYGIVQWTAGVPRVLWRIKDYMPEAASGTLINRNHFATLLYLGLACTLSVIESRRRDDRVASSRETGVAVTLYVFCGLQIAALLASQSRAGIGLAVILLIASLPILVRGTRLTRVLTLAMLALVAVPMAFVVAPALSGRFGSLSDNLTSEVGRGAVYRAGLSIVRDFPVFGTGGGTFEPVFAHFRPSVIQGRYVYAHNDYLQMLIETGVVGLVLALLPVGLYVAGVIRAWIRPARDGSRRAWPLWFGLGLVALHELVDFPLQTPAHAVLVAILAGAAAPAAVRGRPLSRATRAASAVLGAACLLVAPIVVLNDLALWPRSSLSWPDLAKARHERQRELVTMWDADRANVAPLCEALETEIRALELRPLSAAYSRDVARVSALLFLEGGDGVARDALERQVIHASEHSRRVDPWNSWIRARLMKISLSIGALDLVVKDANVVSSVSESQAEDVVRTLADEGLPPIILADLIGGEPNAYRELLLVMIDAANWEDARVIVPVDVEATPVRCVNGFQVGTILIKAHETSPERFYRDCLRHPEVAGNAKTSGDVTAWLIVELLRLSRVDEAAELQEGLRRGPEEYRLRLRIARARGDWEEVARSSRALLELGRDSLSPDREAEMRVRLAEAYARTGRNGLALKELESARRADPTFPAIDRLVRDLRRGRWPPPE